MFSFFRPFIFKLEPERAHRLAIESLKLNYLPKSFFKTENEEMLEIKAFNKKFPNPIGLAAGFDKSAEVYNSLFRFGFGFVEIGTVTPVKQYGNPKPRIFRLERDEAMINRLGFNNDGIKLISERITKNKSNGILGINIGPNKNTENQEEDFILGFKNFYNLADYITINISSPNTENLRDFHQVEKLIKLLKLIKKEKEKYNSQIPIMLKISPDIEDKTIEEIADVAINNSITALILTNTTNKNRNKLIESNKNEIGGLSGKPLENISNNLIKKFYKKLKNKVLIIGVGGIDSGKSAYNKIISGATLLQLYTGMVYKGPEVVKNIKKDLINHLKQDGVKNFKEIIGQGN
ncbi:MAG: quinone-dependent dihydroorotate dehydrogenase [Candidatus Pelagibacterales bacterium]|nr:MAG: quinone-dependent dihydroorotate dehydrogenase [Pelagibacterales bacterium]